MKLPLWSRLRLAPRIALVVFCSLMAMTFVDEVAPLVIRPSEIVVFQRDWLIGTLRDIRDRSIEAPAAERAAVLQELPARRWLDVTVLETNPGFHKPTPSGGFTDLREQIAATLGLESQDVVLMAREMHDPDQSVRSLVVILPELPVTLLNKVADDQQRNMMSSDLRIGFRIGPQQWLVVTPKSDGMETARMIRNVLLPLAAILFIILFSVWVARGVARPLDDLAAAAEKLGRDRELSLVGNFNAPELRAIGETFNAMQRRLKQFVDDRLHMIAAISHDLRTPLTRLRLFAEYVPDPDQRRQVLSDIKDMEAMVSATLTYASNQLKDEAHSAVDLGSLLISLCDTAADAGCRVTYEGPDHAGLVCRPVAIRRAFANLIDNGCKFGSEVKVTLRDTPDSIVITIADDGPGVPAAQREEAFRPFTRLEVSRNRETGGTGLGLTIARDVILAQGGVIELGDAPAGGLLVTVTLRRQQLS
ncbi:ATP-binding protein [Oceanibaculum pacificum]|nr:ATP-binding protein [Oceanibaculum pacificum]